MLRDKNLVPLSHQHQHALALCVCLDRDLKTGTADAAAWQDEMVQILENEIRFHFEAEEKVLFPAAEKLAALLPLVDQLRSEHGVLRGLFARAARKELDPAGLQTFADTLAQHIRTEERQLFERCQELMAEEEMGRLGAAMQHYFEHSGMPGAVCSIRSVNPDTVT